MFGRGRGPELFGVVLLAALLLLAAPAPAPPRRHPSSMPRSRTGMLADVQGPSAATTPAATPAAVLDAMASRAKAGSVSPPFRRHQALHAAAATTPVRVPLANYGDTQYVAEITLGTQTSSSSQIFTVTMDTGSSDVWVPSARCGVACRCLAGCVRHTFYPSRSSTFTPSAQRFNETYGSGSISCEVGRDVLSLGGSLSSTSSSSLSSSSSSSSSSPTATAPDFLFGMATWESPAFSNFEADGIMGLGLSGLAKIQEQDGSGDAYWGLGHFFSANPSLPRYFSVSMYSDRGGAGRGGAVAQSALTFGGYDTIRVNNVTAVPGLNFAYTDAHTISSGGASFYAWWMITIQPFVGLARVPGAAEANQSSAIDLCSVDGDNTACYGIVDTGTSLVGVPTTAWDDLLLALSTRRASKSNDGDRACRSEEGYGETFTVCDPCARVAGTKDTLTSCYPTLSFVVPLSPTSMPVRDSAGRLQKSYVLELAPEDYLEVTKEGLRLLMFQTPSALSDSPVWILGDVFIRKYVTIFELEGQSSKVGEAWADNRVPRVGFSTTSGYFTNSSSSGGGGGGGGNASDGGWSQVAWICVCVGAGVVFFAFVMMGCWACSKCGANNNRPARRRLSVNGQSLLSSGVGQSRLAWPSPMGMGMDSMAVEGQVTGVYDPQHEQGQIQQPQPQLQQQQQQQSYYPPPRIAVEGTVIQPARTRRLSSVSAEYLG